MSIDPQTYAGLANDSYNAKRKAGVRPAGTDDPVRVNGIEFNVLEQYDNPKTGYQGTTYRRVVTVEIIVAHLGT